jgi:hypothetical protein
MVSITVESTLELSFDSELGTLRICNVIFVWGDVRVNCYWPMTKSPIWRYLCRGGRLLKYGGCWL